MELFLHYLRAQSNLKRYYSKMCKKIELQLTCCSLRCLNFFTPDFNLKNHVKKHIEKSYCEIDCGDKDCDDFSICLQYYYENCPRCTFYKYEKEEWKLRYILKSVYDFDEDEGEEIEEMTSKMQAMSSDEVARV